MSCSYAENIRLVGHEKSWSAIGGSKKIEKENGEL